MPQKVDFQPVTEIKVIGVVGFMKRQVTAYGTGAKVTCPKEYLGFSGLVFGLSKRKGMEALCLFVGTEPKEDDLEFPDKEASDRALDKLNAILGFHE